ncbi:hypothetical protein O5541_05140 [Escherichia coli]|nr:hypothetical protein [Escherichia coli]
MVNLTDQWMVAILVRLLNARVKISQDYHHRQAAFGKIVSLIWCRCRRGNVVESNLSVLCAIGA